MEIQRIAIPLLLTAGLLAGGAVRSQEPAPPEPPPFGGNDQAMNSGDDAQPVTEAPTNDPSADPSAESLDYFHEQLAPYGQWTTHASYGDVWVPQVANGWRPYTSGHWGYTDQGWGWIADEPWGWATFHYGRWFYDQSLGWAWVPGNVWAPAWVAWRHGDGYVGWAPLPPSVEFSAEGGLGVGVAAITAGYFSFVAERNLLAAEASGVIVPSVRNVTIISRTENVTRYAVSNSRVVNAGVDVRRIEQATGRPVPRLRVEAMAAASARGRGVFYQPPVVGRAARATHAEFGREVDSRAAAQRRYRQQKPAPESSSAQGRGSRSEPRHSPGFNNTPDRAPDRRAYPRPSYVPDSNRARTYTPPERQSQQSHPATPQTRDQARSYDRAQPQPRSQERSQPRTQERPQPRSQERSQPQPQTRSHEKSQEKSSDNSKHKPPL